ncbi:MAG: AMP-binding protein, partial [Thermoanaerobaculia bacterium]
ALLFSGIASISLWSEAKEEFVSEVVNQAEPTFGFVDSSQRKKILEKIAKIKLFSPDDLKEIKKIKFENSFILNLIEKVEADREAFIQFTSGSTGEMKGVILTHRNICSQQKAFSLLWKIPPSSRFLSYLPWHHSYGGLNERFIAINYGVNWYEDPEIGKNIDKLFHQWERVKPTHFFSVPKIYVEIVKKLEENKGLKEVFFHKDLKILFTAGAPLPKKCAKFFEKNGVVVMEGWGLTETSPTVTLTSPKGGRIHSYVGFPIPGCSIKVDKDGEIYVKGPNVMKGYLDEEKTKEVFIDGWFKTGDVGKITKKGLKLICRNDGIFKLSNGKKVASFPIEEKLNFISKEIQNVIVFGDGMEKAGALVFIGPEKDIEKIKKEILGNLSKWKPEKLPFEGIVIIPKNLSPEKNEITPTHKIVRSEILKNYKDCIKALYFKGNREFERFILRF